jgi:hypothetical protein
MSAVVPDPEEAETIAATAALLAGLMGAAAAAEEGAAAPGLFERLGGLFGGAPAPAPATGTGVGSWVTGLFSGRGSAPAPAPSGGTPTGPTIAVRRPAAPTGPTIGARVGSVLSGMASTSTGHLPGATGAGLSAASVLDAYTGGATTLAEYVDAAAKAATLGPFTWKAEPAKPRKATWADAVIMSAGSRSAAETLDSHVRMFDEVRFVDPAGNEAMAELSPIQMKIELPGGKTDTITVRNPYNPGVWSNRIQARKGLGPLPAENIDVIRKLGVTQINGFNDSRRQLKLLESLWLCGNNRGIGCFPELVMLELVEAMKVGSEAKAHAEARRILQNSSMGLLKSAVEKYLTANPKPAAVVARAAVPGSADAAVSRATDAAVPGATGAVVPRAAGAAVPRVTEAVVSGTAGAAASRSTPTIPGTSAVVVGGARRSLRVHPRIGAIGAVVPKPRGVLGAIPV